MAAWGKRGEAEARGKKQAEVVEKPWEGSVVEGLDEHASSSAPLASASEVQADSGWSCAQEMETRAETVGTMAMSIEAQLRNPTAFALGVSDLTFIASVGTAHGSSPLAPHPSTWPEDATIVTAAQEHASTIK